MDARGGKEVAGELRVFLPAGKSKAEKPSVPRPEVDRIGAEKRHSTLEIIRFKLRPIADGRKVKIGIERNQAARFYDFPHPDDLTEDSICLALRRYEQMGSLLTGGFARSMRDVAWLLEERWHGKRLDERPTFEKKVSRAFNDVGDYFRVDVLIRPVGQGCSCEELTPEGEDILLAIPRWKTWSGGEQAFDIPAPDWLTVDSRPLNRAG